MAMVYSPDGTMSLSAEDLIAAALREWPDARVIRTPERPTSDVTIRIGQGSEEWQIFHHPEGGEVWTDALPDQQLAFAAWIRRAVPQGRLVLLNEDASLAAELEAGMTPEQISDAWNQEPSF